MGRGNLRSQSGCSMASAWQNRHIHARLGPLAPVPQRCPENDDIRAQPMDGLQGREIGNRPLRVLISTASIHARARARDRARVHPRSRPRTCPCMHAHAHTHARTRARARARALSLTHAVTIWPCFPTSIVAIARRTGRSWHLPSGRARAHTKYCLAAYEQTPFHFRSRL
jgi:hypothetical protein